MPKIFNCPRCGMIVYEYPALSRLDNKTKICSACGHEEAMFEFMFLKLPENGNRVQKIFDNLNTLGTFMSWEDEESLKYKHLMKIKERLLNIECDVGKKEMRSVSK
jgi:hypothetical protein